MEISTYHVTGQCQCNVADACVIKQRFKAGSALRHIRYRKPWRCSRVSVYEIDGIKLCAQHAGKIALNYLLTHQRQLEAVQMKEVKDGS